MEVPAPDSGKAAATGKRGTGVGSAPESPGRGRVRGRGAEGTPRRVARQVGVACRQQQRGRGAEGARRKGEGLPAVPRPSALPVLAPWLRCASLVIGLLLLLSFRHPPVKIKPKTSCRGVALACETAPPRC